MPSPRGRMCPAQGMAPTKALGQAGVWLEYRRPEEVKKR